MTFFLNLECRSLTFSKLSIQEKIHTIKSFFTLKPLKFSGNMAMLLPFSFCNRMLHCGEFETLIFSFSLLPSPLNYRLTYILDQYLAFLHVAYRHQTIPKYIRQFTERHTVSSLRTSDGKTQWKQTFTSTLYLNVPSLFHLTAENTNLNV